MLNLLTAIFVESLQELTKQGAASQAALAAEKKQKLVEFIRDTFNTFDEDSSGTLDKDEVFRTPPWSSFSRVPMPRSRPHILMRTTPTSALQNHCALVPRWRLHWWHLHRLPTMTCCSP
jgi:hypothetical protein